MPAWPAVIAWMDAPFETLLQTSETMFSSKFDDGN